jgi:hypothetical protein
MKRTNSNFSVKNALEKEEQGKLITSAGIMMENDVIGTATNYDNPYRMAANQSWQLSSLISMDKSVEEMVVVDMDDSEKYAGTQYGFEADIVMYAKDGQRDRIDYDVMNARWKSNKAPRRPHVPNVAQSRADQYLKQAFKRDF